MKSKPHYYVYPGLGQKSPEAILQKVCEAYNADVNEVLAAKHNWQASEVCAVTAILMKEFLKIKPGNISYHLNRDRTTILYHIKTINNRLSVEKPLQERFLKIQQTIQMSLL